MILNNVIQELESGDLFTCVHEERDGIEIDHLSEAQMCLALTMVDGCSDPRDVEDAIFLLLFELWAME